MADARLRRLLSLLLILREKEWVSAGELAERFGVTHRTVYRDVDALQRHGIPIRGIRGREGGYRLEAESPLSSLGSLSTLGSTDAVLLLALRAAVSGCDSTDSAGLGRLFEGLEQAEVDKLQRYGARIHFDTREWYWKDAGEVAVPHLRRAVLDQIAIRIRYQSRDAKGVEWDLVEPYGLVWKGGSWYVVGRSVASDKVRRYRASRVFDIVSEDRRFKYPGDFDLHDWWQTEVESFGKGKIRVRLLASEDSRDELLQLAGKEETEFEEFGGGLRLTLHVDRWEWLVPLLMSFGAAVVVEEPAPLRDTLLQAHKRGAAAQKKGVPGIGTQVLGDARIRATRGRDRE